MNGFWRYTDRENEISRRASLALKKIFGAQRLEKPVGILSTYCISFVVVRTGDSSTAFVAELLSSLKMTRCSVVKAAY